MNLNEIIIDNICYRHALIGKPIDCPWNFLRNKNNLIDLSNYEPMISENDHFYIYIVDRKRSLVCAKLCGNSLIFEVIISDNEDLFEHALPINLSVIDNIGAAQQNVIKVKYLLNTLNNNKITPLFLKFTIHQHWQTNEILYFYSIHFIKNVEYFFDLSLAGDKFEISTDLSIDILPETLIDFIYNRYNLILDFTTSLEHFKSQLSLIDIQKI